MTIQHTFIKDCFLVTPTVFNDERGSFFEAFNQKAFRELSNLNIQFVQDNQSVSKRNVLRGLHLQLGEHAQSKLVRVIKGEVLDVCVDVRKESKTFGKHISHKLSDENNHQLFIPKGCAHGFLVLSEQAIVTYKCDAFYNKASESGIIYNDSELNIDWSLPNEDIILSEKDTKLLTLKEFSQLL
jgi:dTDP-4-dehydrorhamnose 3,5-epimerase